MIIQFILFLLLLFSLFLLSQKIQTHIYNSLFIITKSERFAVGVLLVLLLPGTIIHELSHFLVATILRVPTGELTIIPTIEKSGEVKAGKLFLGNTDPFRLSLIGLAPMIIGLGIIYAAGKFFLLGFPQLFSTDYRLQTVFCFYLLFITSITMFSSKKDLEGLKFALPVIMLIFIALYVAGVRLFFDNSLISKIELFLSGLNYYLSITAVINFLVFLILSANLYLIKRLS